MEHGSRTTCHHAERRAGSQPFPHTTAGEVERLLWAGTSGCFRVTVFAAGAKTACWLCMASSFAFKSSEAWRSSTSILYSNHLIFDLLLSIVCNCARARRSQLSTVLVGAPSIRPTSAAV